MAQITKDIPIIGGGSTGPMLLIYLAQKAQENGADLSGTRFHLIDPKGFGNGGIAYGEAHSTHKLNSTRDEMSPWNPAEFQAWCIREGLGDNIQDFNARAENGRFLSEKLAWAKHVLERRGASFKEHLAKASITDNGDNFDVTDANGNVLVSDIAAEDINITVGYGANENFSNLWAYSGEGYVHSSYYHDQISAIPSQIEKPRVAFIGTGPALYDFVNAYDGDPDQTELVVFSRKGNLLDTRDVTVEPDEVSIVPDYLADESYVPTNFAQLKAKILADFDTATDRSPRRVALDIMKSIKPLLSRVSLDLAKEFRCSGLHSWLKHTATPVPPESQARLEEFDPTVIAGKLNGNIERLDNGTFKISVDGQEPVIVDYIVNGTGHGRHNHAIFEDLKAKGLATVDERFDTLATEENGYRLEGAGFNCVGPAIHFGIDGMESFAVYAEKLASDILKRTADNDNTGPYAHIGLAPEQEIRLSA